MFDLQLISIWKAQRHHKYYVNFHCHNCYELVYYPFGSGETKIGSQIYTFSDNSFAVIPPRVSHDEVHHSNSEVICLEFSSSQDLSQGFHKDPFGTIHKILKDLIHEVKNQNYGYQDMIAVKLNELYLHILRSQNDTAGEKNFKYIINYISENYHEKILLSDCARQLNLSYDYFQHKFKAVTGYSPQQFLMKQRLTAAQMLLKDGGLRCTEIAYRCGFSTSAQFSALFKKEYGLTPLQFQKAVKAESGQRSVVY